MAPRIWCSFDAAYLISPRPTSPGRHQLAKAATVASAGGGVHQTFLASADDVWRSRRCGERLPIKTSWTGLKPGFASPAERLRRPELVCSCWPESRGKVVVPVCFWVNPGAVPFRTERKHATRQTADVKQRGGWRGSEDRCLLLWWTDSWKGRLLFAASLCCSFWTIAAQARFFSRELVL